MWFPSCTHQVLSRPASQGSTTTHRVLLPATSQSSSAAQQQQQLAPLRPAGSQQQHGGGGGGAGSSGGGGGFPQLPPGTTIISGGQNLGGGVQGFALVPAQYVTQVRRLCELIGAARVFRACSTLIGPRFVTEINHSNVLREACGNECDCISSTGTQESFLTDIARKGLKLCHLVTDSFT